MISSNPGIRAWQFLQLLLRAAHQVRALTLTLRRHTTEIVDPRLAWGGVNVLKLLLRGAQVALDDYLIIGGIKSTLMLYGRELRLA